MAIGIHLIVEVQRCGTCDTTFLLGIQSDLSMNNKNFDVRIILISHKYEIQSYNVVCFKNTYLNRYRYPDSLLDAAFVKLSGVKYFTLLNCTKTFDATKE